MKAESFVLAVVLLFVTVTAQADVIPGRWEKVDQLRAGSALVVLLTAGDRLEGQFVASTPEELTIQTDGGRQQPLPKASISRVSLVKHESRRVLIGAAVGAGAGVATGLAISTQFDETFFARGDLMALTCGAIGALTGALIGNAVSRPAEQEVVFRRD